MTQSCRSILQHHGASGICYKPAWIEGFFGNVWLAEGNVDFSHDCVARRLCNRVVVVSKQSAPHGLGHLEIQQENHHISTNLTQHGMGISRYFLTSDISMVECQNGHLRGSFRCLVFSTQLRSLRFAGSQSELDPLHLAGLLRCVVWAFGTREIFHPMVFECKC